MNEDVLIRIVDDDASVRDALVYMLDLEGFSVATYASAEEFLTTDAPSRPGVVVLDVRMDGMSGTELQDVMIERGIRLPIIFLTGHGDVDMAVKALRKGAFHFLQKPVNTDELIQTIRDCLQTSLNNSSQKRLEESLALLTSRERQILKLLLQGLVNQTIAQRLGLSVRTVENHRNSLYRKLRVNSYSELQALVFPATESSKNCSTGSCGTK